MDNGNKNFEEKMREIAAWESIESYFQTKQTAHEYLKYFSPISLAVKKEKDKRIQLLYSDSCVELEQIRVWDSELKKVLSALKLFAEQGNTYNTLLYKLSKNFKNNLFHYKDAVEKFKNNFTVLRNLLKNKNNGDDDNNPYKPITR